MREYALLYAMNRERLHEPKSDILVLAPGPINRGVEVTPDVADGPHSADSRTSDQRLGRPDGRAVAGERRQRRLIARRDCETDEQAHIVRFTITGSLRPSSRFCDRLEKMRIC